MKNLFPLLLSLTCLFVFNACDTVDPEIENEEELITTVEYTLVPEGGGDSVVLTFADEDGDGPGAAEITGGALAANQVYSGTLVFLDETKTPAEDITEEVEEEADEHQVFFSSSSSLNLTFAYDDEDSGGFPIGLQSTVTTGDASTGSLGIILRHEPVKDGAGVADGDITNAEGETDVEVSFPIEIE